MTGNNKYPHLLSPLKVNGIVLKNRAIMGSMHTGLEEEKDEFEKLSAYYEERAKGNVGLIVTGGIAPCRLGWLAPFGAKMSSHKEARQHRKITDRVHGAGGRVALQILHAGRYGYHPFCVAPSAIKSPISPFKPWKMPNFLVESTIKSFVTTAQLAVEAGYDGVEIMGSEGYLINQFISSKTNKRSDKWGGEFLSRCRFPLEIVRKTREAVGDKVIIIYRLSMADLVEEGSSWEEVVTLGKAIEEAGASMLNTGIGWHEARVPTIAASVPHAAFVWASSAMRKQVGIPVITSNRINSPEIAEAILEKGEADFVSMARPFLADPYFMKKAESNCSELINTCIACNQACLDHVFAQKRASCLVNPRACYETELLLPKVKTPKKILVVGAGPAGLAFSCYAAERGHIVTLMEKDKVIGGQFLMAKDIPGKEDFAGSLRYFENRLRELNVSLTLDFEVNESSVNWKQFDEVICATGVIPRKLSFPGSDHSKVLSYVEVLKEKKPVGPRVGIIGAGGIGFDVATYLLESQSKISFYDLWGIDPSYQNRGALKNPALAQSSFKIYLMQRKPSKLGQGLGKTTGWIHRKTIEKFGVIQMSDVSYQSFTDEGLRITWKGKEELLEIDHLIVCAGQEENLKLYRTIKTIFPQAKLIGGAHKALELDAKAAIKEAAELASQI